MTVKKTINKHIENTAIKKLSIQFSLDGFSFSIGNKFHQTHTFLAYSFGKRVATPEQLLEKISAIFKAEALLQQDFSNVFVLHQNNLATLVPTPFFDENNLKEYLNFTVKTFSSDFIAFDTIEKINAKNVYVPYVNINNYIFQNFGEFEYKHHTTVLIDKLLAYNKTTEKKRMYVHVANGHFDMVVLEKQQVLLCNSFAFETKEDFIYYILFTAEQLQLDPEIVPLTFLGNIEKNMDIYTIAYTYIRNINFLESKSAFFTDETNMSTHANFILID